MKTLLDDVIELVKNPPSWLWKVLGGLVLLVVVLVVKYQLDQQAAENARLKTELERQRYDAEQLKLKASLQGNADAAAAAEAEANDKLEAANAALAALAAKEKAAQLEMSRLQAVKAKDWDALNKMAGI